MKSNEVLIFSTRLAQLLLSNGCELITVREDRRNTGRNVYIFEDSPQLRILKNQYCKEDSHVPVSAKSKSHSRMASNSRE